MVPLPTLLVSRREFLRSAAVPVAFAPAALAAAPYDLLIHGGRVLDASQNIDKIADVAIRDGRIAAVRQGIPPSAATHAMDATGKLVTPGLIDIHTHMADPKLPPGTCLNDGVTTLVDAGSRGCDNAADLLKIAQSTPIRLRILLNIGKKGNDPEGELKDLANVDSVATRKVIERYREWIVGIKVRISRPLAGDHDLEAIRLARQAADPLKIPLMVHVGDSVSPLPDVLALLRPGDIVTHVYAPEHGILDEQGKVLQQVRDARKRGVLFDIGNGRAGHITWEVAQRALEQDFLPDTISTDLNLISRTYQVFSLPNVMSKFLMLGMPVDQVIARVTANAARAIPELKAHGTLRTGAIADVAVLDIQQGEFEFVDNLEAKRTGKQKLVPFAVISGGARI